jgi:hypothetical protein
MNALCVIVLAIVMLSLVAAAPTTQLSIDRVDLMRNQPMPYKLKDFKATARGLDKLLFDFDQKGQYLPIIWWDDTKVNVPMRGFGLPAYVGRPSQSSGGNHESIVTMGVLLGSTLAGIDKSHEPMNQNWVQMAQVYFNSKNGQNVVLDGTSTETGGTYWYELFPQILFNCLVDRYPDTPGATEIMRTAAERWYGAYEVLKKQPGGLNFDHTAFNLKTMQPIDNGKWHEPDGASGMAWVLFSAYRKFGDEKYLNAAKDLCAYTDSRDTNPHYEINHLWGTYLAARLNAEHGTNYDVKRFVDWCFNPSETRHGWGVAIGRWGDYECSGLAAGVNINGGYGFVMNTYVLGGTLVPAVRYDERFARAVGKWMLNAVNAVRLCYPDELPADHQSFPGWKSEPANVIAYEGLIHVGPNNKQPYAQGDAIKAGWANTDLGIYGSGFTGMFGAMIAPTDVEEILQLDLLACDFFRDQAFPSFLYYNPFDQQRDVTVNVGEKPVDLYDAVANDFVARNVSGTAKVTINPDSAIVLVHAPAGGKISYDGRKTLIDGVVVDFDNGRAARPVLPPRPASTDQSKVVAAHRATIKVDGDASDCDKLQSEPMHLNTGGRAKLEVDLRCAWDDQYLYVLAKQTARGAQVQEAPTAEAYRAEPWNFDGVILYIDVGNGRMTTVGEFTVAMALRSQAGAGFAQAPVSPEKVQIATSGSADAGDRVVEARFAWSDILNYSANNLPEYAKKLGPIRAGFRFGCDPLLVEHSHKFQSFIGGAQYAKPTGRDANSIDIILK